MYRRKTRPNIPQQQSAAQTAPLPAPSARWSALAKAVHIGINSRDLRKEFARSGRDPDMFFTVIKLPPPKPSLMFSAARSQPKKMFPRSVVRALRAYIERFTPGSTAGVYVRK